MHFLVLPLVPQVRHQIRHHVIVVPLSRHPQVSQDTANAPLILWRLLVHLRILQNLFQHVLRLNWAQQQSLVLHNRVQPLGDIARPLVQVELEPKYLLVLQRRERTVINLLRDNRSRGMIPMDITI